MAGRPWLANRPGTQSGALYASSACARAWRARAQRVDVGTRQAGLIERAARSILARRGRALFGDPRCNAIFVRESMS
jgi:hypothetical protein